MEGLGTVPFHWSVALRGTPTVLHCPGLREFLEYRIFSGEIGQVPGRLGQVGHPSPLW